MSESTAIPLKATCAVCGWSSAVVDTIRCLPDGRFQYRCGKFIAHTEHGATCHPVRSTS